MNPRIRLVLDDSNSRRYRPRPVAKHAQIQWDAGEYQLSGGKQQCKGPHVQVTDPGGSYGVDLATFFTTHKPIPDRKDHYIKSETVIVRAMCAQASFELPTIVNDVVEMIAQVVAGEYVVQNPGGEQYAMSADSFFLRYAPVE